MTRRRRTHGPGQAALVYKYHSFPSGLDGTDGGFGGRPGRAVKILAQGNWVCLGRQMSKMTQASRSLTWSL
jgi:hypothetical protein